MAGQPQAPFERFSDGARTAVVVSQEVARLHKTATIEPDHLALAALRLEDDERPRSLPQGQQTAHLTGIMAAMERVGVNGVELAFVREGTGPRLLFLNGSGMTLESSAVLRQAFVPSFEVLSLDPRGIGGSTIPDEPFTMADCAADALALMDHVGWASCRVMGISFGGMLAQELAVTEPERVERLALLCTSAGGDGGSSFPLHDTPARETVLDTRFTPEWLAEHPGDAALVGFLAKRMAEPKSRAAVHGEREQLEARRHHDVWDRLDRITAPTFVAGGRYDGLAPFANSEAIASRISDAELHAYEGGHAFFIQDPQAFPDVIVFLRT